MKKILVFLSLLLGLTEAHAVEYTDISKLDYAVYAEPATGQIGNYVDIYIRTKTQMVSTGYGIDLVMPEGVSVDSHESLRSGDFVTYSSAAITSRGDNRYRFNYVISSISNMLNARTDTLTQHIRLKIDKSVMPGDYALKITNSEIVSETGAAGTMKRPADIYSKLTLQKNPVITELTTSVDLRGIDDTFGTVDVSANPNILIFANEGQVDNENNVVINGECESLILTDKYPFSAPEEFVALYACYEREITGMSTLYLPFGFKPSGFNAYVLSSEADGMLKFTSKTTTCTSYTPLIVCPKAGAASCTIFIEKEEVTISPSSEKSVSKNGYSLSGVLSTKVLKGTDGYFVFSASDHKFKKCNDAGTTIRAFRCFVQAPKSAAAKSEFDAVFDEVTTAISQHPTADTAHPTLLTDLQGRQVSSPKANQIYIFNGKKAVFK